MKVITIRLDDSLHNQLKSKSEKEDRTIQRHIVHLIKKELNLK
ncbi:MAG: hypothetical protein ACRC6T_15895 [Sarcina sp.]